MTSFLVYGISTRVTFSFRQEGVSRKPEIKPRRGREVLEKLLSPLKFYRCLRNCEEQFSIPIKVDENLVPTGHWLCLTVFIMIRSKPEVEIVLAVEGGTEESCERDRLRSVVHFLVWWDSRGTTFFRVRSVHLSGDTSHYQVVGSPEGRYSQKSQYPLMTYDIIW